MKYEPPLDHHLLVQAIQSDYGLPAVDLTFIPVGYVAACYAVRCAGGEQYFLKWWPTMAAGREEAADIAGSLHLTRALYERGIYTRLPYPLLTRGEGLLASFAGSPYALFPF